VTAGGNLVLIGFMGSGKSSVGALVAERLAAGFVDVDAAIEEMTGLSVPEMFERYGEDGFRSFESAALAQALGGTRQVVAVGGGAPVADPNWKLISEGNVVVRLKASMAETLRRLGEGRGRPLAGGGPAEQVQRLTGLLSKREDRYVQARFQVDTTGRDLESVAEEVADIARRQGFGAGASE
jgi:shikimate kinase